MWLAKLLRVGATAHGTFRFVNGQWSPGQASLWFSNALNGAPITGVAGTLDEFLRLPGGWMVAPGTQ